MTASSFTNFPSGTRRYLPQRTLWSRVHPIADRIGEAVVSVILGWLVVLVVLAWLR